MTERHFACTSCGQCCYGWLPLTIDDALTHAARFPLALMWTPLRSTNKSYDLGERLGLTVLLPNRKRVVVLVTPTSYVPPSFSCPLLSSDNLCSIQETKPLRCKTMPFFPYREEEDQTGLLVPRKGWLCDVSQAAPVVYKNKKIIDRADFDREYAALEAQAPFLRRYVDFMLKQNAQVRGLLTKAATTPITGWFALNFSPLLRLNKKYDVADFARRQRPVLMSFAEKTSKAPNLVEYHQYYLNAASDLAGYF